MQQDCSVGSPSILMIPKICAKEIELTVREVPKFSRQGKGRSDSPIKTQPRTHFGVSDDCVIEFRLPAGRTKTTSRSECLVLKCGAAVQGEPRVGLIFKSRRWHDRIEHPLSGKFPANASTR